MYGKNDKTKNDKTMNRGLAGWKITDLKSVILRVLGE
jgi:hypothetical protein